MDDLSPRTHAALVKLAARFGLDLDAVINRYLNNRAYAAGVGDRYPVAELEAAIRAYLRYGVAAL